MLSRCTSCGNRGATPALRCPACGRTEFTQSPTAEPGVVEATTTVHREAPVRLVMVTLRAQPDLALLASAAGDFAIGDVVTVADAADGGFVARSEQ